MSEQNAREFFLNLIRILDNAILMERNASFFYINAAKRVKSDEGKKMFEWLANFESGHEARLISRRRDIFSHPAMEGIPHFPVEDQRGQSEARQTQISDEPSDTEVLMVAIDNEKIAKTYYETEAEKISDKEMVTVFLNMAKDEERHIKILSEQLNHLQVERFWLDLAAFDKTKE